MFELGDFEIHLLPSVAFRLDGGGMFGVVPKVIWDGSYPADEKNRIAMNTNLMLVKAYGRNVLIDTGVGNKLNKKWQKIYGITDVPSMDESLAPAGITSADVDIVIFTHLHFDHAGGALTAQPDGSVIPTFPNARYVAQEKDYDYGSSGHIKAQATYVEENFVPLKEMGLLDLIDGPTQLMPGIKALPTRGHTPAMNLVRVDSGGQSAWHLADLMPLSGHVAPLWVMSYDLFPYESLEAKLELLPELHKEDAILVFEHEPEPCAGRLEKHDRGFSLRKLESV